MLPQGKHDRYDIAVEREPARVRGRRSSAELVRERDGQAVQNRDNRLGRESFLKSRLCRVRVLWGRKVVHSI